MQSYLSLMKTNHTGAHHYITLLFVLVFGWLASTNLRGDETLTNGSVIELQEIGLNETTIVEKIKTSKCSFDVSVSALKELKKAKLSDAVIQAMLAQSPGSNRPEELSTKPTVPSDENNPEAPHDAGIWLLQKSGNTNKMTEIDAALFNQMQTGSGMGAAFGVSMSMKVALNGAQAKTRIFERKPTFYFYFGDAAPGTATTPSEFTLVKAEPNNDKKAGVSRLIRTGKINAYSGTRVGFDPKSVVAFDFEKISKGVYKVTPQADLAIGEYCFCQGSFAGGTGGKVYDFGIAAE